jgi:outer membrane protein assembly factor BamB
MKRLTLILLVPLGALLLSACSGGATTASWPGLTVDANDAYLAGGSYIYAVRLSDGAKDWQYPDKAGAQLFYMQPVLTSDGQLLIGSSGADYGLVNLDAASGHMKWAVPFVANNHWVASPLVVEQTVYAPNTDGTLYALDLGTGQMKWSLQLGSPLWGAPVTNGKLIYVTSLGHQLYAVDPQSHTTVWKLDLGGAAPGSASVGSDGSTVYAASFAKKVYAVDAGNGAVRWAADLKDWVWAAPVLDADTVYAADLSGNVYSLGAPNGKNAWPDLQPDGPITASPLALGDGVVVATESGTLYAYDRSGTKMWDAILGGKIYTAPAASADRIAVAPLGADFLLAALSRDGKLVWKFTGK